MLRIKQHARTGWRTRAAHLWPGLGNNSATAQDGRRWVGAGRRPLLNEQPGAQVRLADVAGLEVVKAHLESSFLGLVRNPQLRKMYGATEK